MSTKIADTALGNRQIVVSGPRPWAATALFTAPLIAMLIAVYWPT